MSDNSTGGSYYTTTKAMMKAYDKLPPAARQAFANSIENWVPQPLLTRYRRGWLKTGSECADLVNHWDLRELAKREEQRRRAVGPYKGNVPEKLCKAR